MSMDKLLDVTVGILAKARSCDRCYGTGVEPATDGDACRDCGGVGEVCECGECLHSLRAALVEATAGLDAGGG